MKSEDKLIKNLLRGWEYRTMRYCISSLVMANPYEKTIELLGKEA